MKGSFNESKPQPMQMIRINSKSHKNGQKVEGTKLALINKRLRFYQNKEYFVSLSNHLNSHIWDNLNSRTSGELMD